MQNKHRSLLEELDSIAIPRDRVHLIESRAQHIIAGAINLVNLIRECYDDDVVEEMERKLLLAITIELVGKLYSCITPSNIL